jgi:hypothetical protein
MKNYALLLGFLFLSTIAASQSVIQPLPSDTLVNATVDLSDEYTEIHINTKIKNISPDSLRVRWEIVPVGCPDSWKFIGGDENAKYPFSANSNYNPNGQPMVPLILEPTDPNSIIILIVRPTYTAGCCEVYMNYSLIEQWDSVIASTHYDIRVNLPECVSVVNDEVAASGVTISPNPFSATFEINSKTPVASLQVFSGLGKGIQCNTFGQGQYELLDAPPGIYFLAIKLMDGSSAWQKVVKIR